MLSHITIWAIYNLKTTTEFITTFDLIDACTCEQIIDVHVFLDTKCQVLVHQPCLKSGTNFVKGLNQTLKLSRIKG